ncbi:MAG: DUF3501 family protein [Thiotrichales bacterium]
MAKLSRDDLMPLEQYAAEREAFRQQVMAHKKQRVVQVGPNMTLHFEDSLVMQYQIQEMLRVERIFEAEGIQEELDAYNPLIPDGSNWKATQMIEFADPAERAEKLAKLVGIDRQTWVRVGDMEKVYAISDEDLDRESEDKTSSVHFLRFELSEPMVAAVKSGSGISAGVDHEEYNHVVQLSKESVESLKSDLD